MKRAIPLLVVLLSLGLYSTSLAAPYAKKVEITSGTTPMGEMVIGNSRVPEASEVNIPPYPGALLFQNREAGAMKVNGKDALPYVKLLTPDEMEKVVAWYKKELASFYFEKLSLMGMNTYRFWEKKGNYGPFDLNAAMENVNLVISDGALHQDDYPKANTMIEITYRSTK